MVLLTHTQLKNTQRREVKYTLKLMFYTKVKTAFVGVGGQKEVIRDEILDFQNGGRRGGGPGGLFSLSDSVLLGHISNNLITFQGVV